jgi:hypothetical protein
LSEEVREFERGRKIHSQIQEVVATSWTIGLIHSLSQLVVSFESLFNQTRFIKKKLNYGCAQKYNHSMTEASSMFLINK